MRIFSIPLVVVLVLTGCNGPHQTAGQEQDKAAATAEGQPYSGDGPNERIGKAVDRADQAARHAREATADALTKQGNAIRQQADVAADRLEEQARVVRDDADRRADAYDTQARAQRK
jgi:hypothetical protein